MDTTRTMITFKQSGTKFTYRIGGILIHEGHALFQRATQDPEHIFWFLPGGRAEVGESARETLLREMIEELGETMSVGPLLYIIENFFEDHQKHHELGLYFMLQAPPDSYLLRKETIIREEAAITLPLIFDWLPLAQLPTMSIRPRFFREALQTLPEMPVHIVLNDPRQG